MNISTSGLELPLSSSYQGNQLGVQEDGSALGKQFSYHYIDGNIPSNLNWFCHKTL